MRFHLGAIPGSPDFVPDAPWRPLTRAASSTAGRAKSEFLSVIPISDFVAGEDFTIFNDVVLALLEAVPELRGDPDLGTINEGVTILWLK